MEDGEPVRLVPSSLFQGIDAWMVFKRARGASRANSDVILSEFNALRLPSSFRIVNFPYNAKSINMLKPQASCKIIPNRALHICRDYYGMRVQQLQSLRLCCL